MRPADAGEQGAFAVFELAGDHRAMQVEIHAIDAAGRFLFGRLIGRDGRTVRAIRSFVGAAASARGKRVMVRVRD